MSIRKVCPEDTPAICAIINHYILNTDVIFKTETLSTDYVRRQIIEISAKYPYLVYEIDGKVIGYCYVNTSEYDVDPHKILEVTVYIDQNYTGRGVAYRLMRELIPQVRTRTDANALIAKIELTNLPSIRGTERLGFEKVAQFDKFYCKFDRALDLGIWKLTL